MRLSAVLLNPTMILSPAIMTGTPPRQLMPASLVFLARTQISTGLFVGANYLYAFASALFKFHAIRFEKVVQRPWCSNRSLECSYRLAQGYLGVRLAHVRLAHVRLVHDRLTSALLTSALFTSALFTSRPPCSRPPCSRPPCSRPPCSRPPCSRPPCSRHVRLVHVRLVHVRLVVIGGVRRNCRHRSALVAGAERGGGLSTCASFSFCSSVKISMRRLWACFFTFLICSFFSSRVSSSIGDDGLDFLGMAYWCTARSFDRPAPR